MIYLLLSIIVFTFFLYLLYKNYLKVLKITSIITGLSAVITFFIGYIIKIFINTNLSFIKISDVANIIISKFVFNGICLLVISLIEFIFYFIINYILQSKKRLSNELK